MTVFVMSTLCAAIMNFVVLTLADTSTLIRSTLVSRYLSFTPDEVFCEPGSTSKDQSAYYSLNTNYKVS